MTPARDKTLFTPGPLTTSLMVRQAMLRDLGSRDAEFIETVRRIRCKLLELAGVSQEAGYEAILIQGSGTFGVESVLSSVVPPEGRLLVLINGAYGERIAQMAAVLKIPTRLLRWAENETLVPEAVARALTADPALTHVAAIHCETTTGIMNPVEAIGRIVREAGRIYVVDAMSSFGAVPLDVSEYGIDFLISSANKCIEGVPGSAFVLARRAALLAAEGLARSLSLDLLAQWKGLEKDGQFRFTPPTHALLAFEQALQELETEGGVAGRAARYRANHIALLQGMRALGFREYVRPGDQSDIITTFYYPDAPRFRFDEFYDRLNAKGMVIYPGKLTHAECFRIGSIGRLFEADMRALVAAIRETLEEMGIAVPLR